MSQTRRAHWTEIAEAVNLGKFFREQHPDFPAAPSLDGTLMAEGGLLDAPPVGEPRTVEILRAWQRGWKEAEERLNPPIAIEDLSSLTDQALTHLAVGLLLGDER